VNLGLKVRGKRTGGERRRPGSGRMAITAFDSEGNGCTPLDECIALVATSDFGSRSPSRDCARFVSKGLRFERVTIELAPGPIRKRTIEHAKE
jgi:hypothetical protein